METLITNGIKISVQPKYEEEYSNPIESKYIFSYLITIENVGREIVQLLRRHWIIWDSNGVTREVEGDGVVGQQPVINPGEQHTYSSWCNLFSPIGKMFGVYLMTRTSDDHQFLVTIPEFRLIAPPVLN